MHDDSDDLDFIIQEQEDYEMAKFLEDLDAESERVTEDCIHDKDPSGSDRDDDPSPDSSDRITRGGSGGSGSCGNCILYALGAIVVVIVLGYLVNALS